MDDALNLPNANSYWNVLKDLSKEAKLELIARLSNSLLHPEEEKHVSASSFYGVWQDDDMPEVMVPENTKDFKN